jgi:GntR family transcriptional regulator/MocR family aminotransferase
MGDSLPPSRELAGRLSVSRTTVTVAYDRLISEGFAEARRGSGTFVSTGPAPAKPTRRRTGDALTARCIWDEVPLPRGYRHAVRYDFRPGVPDASLFPYQTWRRLINRQLRPAMIGLGAYGEPAGHLGLREAICRHLGISRGVHAVADDVVVTNGTQQALDVIGRALFEPGVRIAVEDPCYAPPRRLFATLGARVSGVPVDDEGLIVESIPRDARFVYVGPSHQFPLGMSMSLPRRLALLDWARRNGAAIIEDDYDSEFRFDGRPIEPLQALDSSGRVIYVGTFSKTLLAALRLGFVIVPASIRSAVRAAKYVADWHTALPAQGALASFIDEGGFARHLRKMRGIYRARHELIVGGLERHFGDELRVVPSSVGLHLSALASSATPAQVKDAVRRAAQAGVGCQPLSVFAVDAPPRAGIVLGYGAIATEDIAEGLQRLRAAFNG